MGDLALDWTFETLLCTGNFVFLETCVRMIFIFSVYHAFRSSISMCATFFSGRLQEFCFGPSMLAGYMFLSKLQIPSEMSNGPPLRTHCMKLRIHDFIDMRHNAALHR